MLKKKNNSDKKILRAALKKARQELSADYVESASKNICENMLASSDYREAKIIFAYLAFGKEVNCDEFIRRAMADGKTICVPFIIDKENFLTVRMESFDNLVLDRYGIRCASEPFVEVNSADIDLILVPGLAFAKDGARIGMGAGYYDRFLMKTKAITIGMAYEKLMQEHLPMDEHDVFVQKIVTEDGLRSAINI